nr:MAG TPA: hypothetical protein [Caudoviricetes sp.]
MTAAGFYRSVADLSFIIHVFSLRSTCRKMGVFFYPKTERK